MKTYRYTVIFEEAEEGGYVVTYPALPGLVTEGDTLEEARAMTKDAIKGYLESISSYDHIWTGRLKVVSCLDSDVLINSIRVLWLHTTTMQADW